jgi:hypothetical protein
MTIEIEISKLSELLAAAAQNGATRALEQTGTISTTITLAEVKKRHGESFAIAARKATAIKWKPVGSGGRTSGVYCKRSEIDKFLFERKFDFNS